MKTGHSPFVERSNRLLRLSALLLPAIWVGLPLAALRPSVDSLLTDTAGQNRQLQAAVVKARVGTKSQYHLINTELIGLQQLQRAACCNLGESFTANPSVDVSYSDAATGARQIKLLGLSGTYVQMLNENVPGLRGAATPYSLGFVPGPWMQSIQVSKGAASVKNGYESITGQINIEYLKPQNTQGVRGNLYLDSKWRQEGNADATLHLNDRLSASLLLHAENRQSEHDGNNDGFIDMPKLRQFNVMQRWAYVSPHWISQLSWRVLDDRRKSGMSDHQGHCATEPYSTDVSTRRYEAQWKNAYLFQDDHNTNLALIVHGSWHDADHTFGHTLYDVNQKNAYAQLLFESDLNASNSLSVGASLNHDAFRERFSGNALQLSPERSNETTPGLYAQWTFRQEDRLTLMPGLRWDHSDRFGIFVTPRIHLRYAPTPWFTLRASAGLGYRTPHALAENSPLLASGRTFTLPEQLQQEKAGNYGITASFNLPLGGKKLELNTEYFYTRFSRQMVVNIDGASGSHSVAFENLDGKSYSHTFQVDATYPFFEGFSTTAAFRYQDARTSYDGRLLHRPLTSRYKGLVTLSYKTPLELWHFDVTAQLNGEGDRYDHTRYPAYAQLQAQVTREFKHFSLYAGAENLTNYRMDQPVLNADNPWSAGFDATQVWGPTDGIMAYIGFRFHFND